MGVGFSVGFAVGLLVGDAVVPETGASITLDGVLVPPGVGPRILTQYQSRNKNCMYGRGCFCVLKQLT